MSSVKILLEANLGSSDAFKGDTNVSAHGRPKTGMGKCFI